jgi:hypothetical protein
MNIYSVECIWFCQGDEEKNTHIVTAKDGRYAAGAMQEFYKLTKDVKLAKIKTTSLGVAGKQL